jgi:hypothetical protein
MKSGISYWASCVTKAATTADTMSPFVAITFIHHSPRQMPSAHMLRQAELAAMFHPQTRALEYRQWRTTMTCHQLPQYLLRHQYRQHRCHDQRVDLHLSQRPINTMEQQHRHRLREVQLGTYQERQVDYRHLKHPFLLLKTAASHKPISNQCLSSGGKRNQTTAGGESPTTRSRNVRQQTCWRCSGRCTCFFTN